MQCQYWNRKPKLIFLVLYEYWIVSISSNILSIDGPEKGSFIDGFFYSREESTSLQLLSRTYKVSLVKIFSCNKLEE